MKTLRNNLNIRSPAKATEMRLSGLLTAGAYIMFWNFYFLPGFLLKTCQFCRKVSTRAVAGLRPLLYFPILILKLGIYLNVPSCQILHTMYYMVLNWFGFQNAQTKPKGDKVYQKEIQYSNLKQISSKIRACLILFFIMKEFLLDKFMLENNKGN